MFRRLYHYLVLRPYWIALIICIILLFWMLSKPTAPFANDQSSTTSDDLYPKVQVTRYTPEIMTKSLTLYGKSEANSHAVIRAKIAGEIIKLTADKGEHLQALDTIANIEKGALGAQLVQAEGVYAERLLNFNAAQSLNEKGLQGRSRLAEVNSLLLAAQTAIEQLKLQLQHSNIAAPFTGILQDKFAQKGDYLQVGDPIFSIENIDPIIIRGDTTEHFIDQLILGEEVTALLLSGKMLTGKISYIAAHADPLSSTFRIEAEFANSDFSIVSGVSAKLSIPLRQVSAIYVSPATLAMDIKGNLGVKAVQDEQVVFKKIDLVEADNEGVWLAGFTQPVDIITLGQGFVKPGDRVEPIVAEK